MYYRKQEVKTLIKNFLKKAAYRLTSKNFLKNIDMDRRAMTELMEASGWKSAMQRLLEAESFSAEALLETLKPAMDGFCTEPDEGWLKYICDDIVADIYPENFSVPDNRERKQGKLFFLENYRMLLKYEKAVKPFSPTDHIELLEDEEASECVTAEEYRTFKSFWQRAYIFEFMRLSREITPYNTIGHIGKVHHVALYIAKQLVNTDIPVDVALVSASAAGHDLGKFGCRPNEAKRIPYLHYYYVDELLKRENMPMIAHIASNHSTWDLELENLSIESLLLIYSDFRVKSVREKGVEKVCLYTLTEAFDVILNKLDNVDDEKRSRYERVYDKLKDFENYLIDMGVETDISKTPPEKFTGRRKDTALLVGDEVVERIKYTAIEHNIKLMSIFNNEAAFGSLLEAARSEKQWKSQRAYLNILSEYFTYMTKHEKILSMHFLYDLLSHREGDIRRQAGKLLGIIISNYDDVYRKELPDFAKEREESRSVDVWKFYLNRIVFPDYRVTDQHRSWIGYTLKSVLQGIIEEAEEKDIPLYIGKFFDMFRKDGIRDSAVFVLLDSLMSIPEELISDEERMSVLKFAASVSARKSQEIKIGTLRAAEYISRGRLGDECRKNIYRILDNMDEETLSISVSYLAYKVLKNMGDEKGAEKYFLKVMDFEDKADLLDDDAVSEVFRENLKVGTPWVVKIVNMDFLLEHAPETGTGSHMFHLAAHYSNLIKVSERVTVRHKAGTSLIDIARSLPVEQINEIVIELTKGLEIGEYQFSKYIPEYLGELALYLYPGELDEFIATLGELIENNNDRVGSVALDTVGEVIKKYSSYMHRDKESTESYEARKTLMLGLLLKGLANYHEVVSQEAIMVIGQYIFGAEELSQDEKFDAFKHIYKKLLTLIPEAKDSDMNFFTNAAALNHIYRFVSEYKFTCGEMSLPLIEKVAFFPGTFDPFSLSHKGIVQAIREEGFEVYLALDEFSWSKKTQARKIRRKITTMSVADETNVFMFPDDFPVNIANPTDLISLKLLFPGRDLYIVVGSDVVINASSYKAEPSFGSIHSMNHIVFKRETRGSDGDNSSALKKVYANMTGSIRELKLPMYLEDISSTRIRENIDRGRDISNLIDPVAQNYIYDNSLYLREPQYKNILEAKNLAIESTGAGEKILSDLEDDLTAKGIDVVKVKEYIDKSYVKTTVIREGSGRICAVAAVNELETGQLYDEFKDAEIAAYLRQKATGRMIIIRGIYCSSNADMRNLTQIIMTEVLSKAVENDITYAIYHPLDVKKNRDIIDVLLRQGFTEIEMGRGGQSIYEVNMKEPVAVIENMDTVLKDPFNKNPRILDILEQTHADMQRALTGLNPGNLVLSFNAGIMNQKIVDMVTRINGVPGHPLKDRRLGECMCVPFGKIMRGIAVPNTVTKTLHTEKMFHPTLNDFTIEEYPMYSTIDNQIKTIKSFNRPVILVDDLLHKGYRIKALDPIFKENDIEIRKLVMGLLSGGGKDLMDIQGREVESAYFIPNLKAWFVESTLCPFIGGDGVRSNQEMEYNLIPSINLLLPFAAPKFLHDASRESIYDLSKVCLENALKIFRTLESEYLNVFERKLTLKRLSDAIISPRMPNGSNRVAADYNLSPSVNIADYLERLERLESALK